MLEDASRLYAMASDAYWIDIGTPEKYLQAHTDVLSAALGGPPAPGARELSPGVWVQGNPTIDPDARIEGPALIGDAATVAAGARVAGSVVGRGAVIGPGARLLRSVVHAEVTLATDAEAIDSVVGAGATLGAGAIVSDHTIMGAAATLDAGARASGARIRRPEPETSEAEG